jgi:hypothetical protein
MNANNQRYLGKTWVTQRMPWGLYNPSGHRLLCSDGVIRGAKLAETADTFFSVPASVRVKGVTVSGYMTCDDNDNLVKAYTFRHHTVHADKLPEWPAKFTPEHNALIQKVAV